VPEERALPADGGSNGIAGRPERREQRVALRPDLVTAVTCERVPQQAEVLGQHRGVLLGPDVAQQPRGALDVGEEEGDRAAW
jgi:hypothetical protein